MQPTTRTEPPDTRKNSELSKSHHFAAYSALKHAPAKSAREKFFPKKYRVTGKKRKMVRLRTRQSDRFGMVELGSRRNAGDHERQALWKALLLRSAYSMQ